MTGLVRKATLFTLCGLMIAGAAMAGVPSASTSTIPAQIGLGAYATSTGPGARIEGGPLNPIFEFVITVRDLASNPVGGATVKINFSTCINFKLGAVQPGPPALTVDCINSIVSTTSAPDGKAIFRIAGNSLNSPGPHPSFTPGNSSGCGQVTASIGTGDIPLGTVLVATADENGSNGINPVDISLIVFDYFDASIYHPGTFYARDEWNVDGATTPVDISGLVHIVLALAQPGQSEPFSCSGAGGCCPP